MWKLLPCVFLVVACAHTMHEVQSAPQAMTRHVLSHDGIEREYFVFVPQNYHPDKRLPVLFFLHGYGDTATGIEAETTNGLNRYAADYGYIVVYPQGTWFIAEKGGGERYPVTSWNHLSGNKDEGPEGPLCTADAPRYPCPPECGACGRCGWTSYHDDVGFVLRLFADIAARPDTDEQRLFLSGFSNGSMMAQRVACVAADRLRAVALVGGRLERGFQGVPDTPLPMLQINGGRDDVVPHQGARPDSKFFYASAAAVDRD